MKRNIYRFGKQVLLAVGLILVMGGSIETDAQTFRNLRLPKLSLTGATSGYNADYYPDGRLRLPQSNGEPREFVVPVFLDNNWDPAISRNIIDQNTNQPVISVSPEPIRSFEFSFYYDSSAVRLIDVVTTGQLHNLIEGNDIDDAYDPILADWDISVDTRRDTSYLRNVLATPSATDRGRGFRATVTGVSSTALPVTFGPEVFCYLKFVAVPDVSNPNTPQTSLNTPLYIANDTVKYNGVNIVLEHPWRKFNDVNSNAINVLQQNDEFNQDYIAGPGLGVIPNFSKDPLAPRDRYVATSGINNYGTTDRDPTPPGSIYIAYTDELPIIALSSDRAGSDNIVTIPAGLQPTDATQYRLSDPITVDASSQAILPNVGTRLLQVSNFVPTTRYRFLSIKTNQEWLKVLPANIGKSEGINEISERELFVNYMDNGILGSSVLNDPLGNSTDDDGDLFINIVCDPSELNNREDDPDNDPTDPEKAGRYYGTITFYSPDVELAPIELLVEFIYFRIPQEACERAQNVNRGIKLDMRNSAGALGERTSLIFGTGNRATRGVDSLFGEFAYETDIANVNGFWARFFPVDEEGTPIENPTEIENGFGDFTPNSEAPRTASRDIRSSDPDQKSIIYYVRFDADGVQNYPVVVSWDVRDFRICDDENGEEQIGDLFLRDTENGRLFPSINMQNGTVIDANRRSYSFQDPEIDEFIIEYTLPNVLEFVDEEGFPIIKEGWNLLSLPVNPTNKNFEVVYPEAIGAAWSYEAKNYSDIRGTEDLRVGAGYFIKYGDDIDLTFSGTRIRNIDEGSFPVRVYGGDASSDGSWNLIGGVSTPAPIEQITFGDYNGRTADREYTLRYGVWRYVPARGYEEVSEIRPGRGYWIKTNEDSYYELCVSGNCKQANVVSPFAEKEALRNSSVAINIADVVGHNGKVYLSANEANGLNFDLPPVPGSDVFDVRFNSNRQLTSDLDELISITGAEFPVKITMENADAEYELFSAVTGQELGRIRPGQGDEVTIHNENINVIGMRKVESAFNNSVTVFPNPTAETLNVNYTIGSTSNVTIELVDAIGNVVTADSFNAETNGTREMDVNAIANGTYLVRIVNGDNTIVAPVTIAK
jgi:hypothetical protein